MALFARTERFKRWNLGLSLFLLMVRTVRGREVIDRIAQRRGFWRLYGRLSVGLVFVTMAGVTALPGWGGTPLAPSPPRHAPPPRQDPEPGPALRLRPHRPIRGARRAGDEGTPARRTDAPVRRRPGDEPT